MQYWMIGAIVFIAAILSVGSFSLALSSALPSIMVQALDCTAPEGFVCVAPDRERANICDTIERFNIPQETAEELDVFADSCS